MKLLTTPRLLIALVILWLAFAVPPCVSVSRATAAGAARAQPQADSQALLSTVGSILEERLDPKTFLATVRLSIDPAYKLPEDTVAEIVSAGLLGDRFLALVPGGSEQMIPPGGRIKFTQSPVSLENLIGQMIFSQPGAQKKPGEGGGAAPGNMK